MIFFRYSNISILLTNFGTFILWIFRILDLLLTSEYAIAQNVAKIPPVYLPKRPLYLLNILITVFTLKTTVFAQKGLKMAQYGPKWSYMIQNSSKCFQMVHNGPKWSKMYWRMQCSLSQQHLLSGTMDEFIQHDKAWD